ncbi:calcium-activated chloride channel regulator 4A-like [Watersipora subatra]|uniref:calcium-activated chloride channel regulator 4A-like n=1 Tax=Watersipora subatra TaxID=2589382 RepID=UPI00355AFDE7
MTDSPLGEKMSKFYIIFCFLVVMVASSNIGKDRQDIRLSPDGGYTDVIVAIDDKVPENVDIINRLKPGTNETLSKARIVVAEPNLAYGDTPYTVQPGRCGVEGDYIHLTPDYLILNKSGNIPYRPEKKIVKEFAKLRWGLFDEDVAVTDKENPQLYWHQGIWNLVGCSQGASFAAVNSTGCMLLNIEGASVCEYKPTNIDGVSSLLSYEYFDNVVNLCDGRHDSQTLHNRLARNLQNKNCNEKSAWEVMTTHTDFATDYNALRRCPVPPETAFRIVKEPYTGPTFPPTTSTQAVPSSSTPLTTTTVTATTTTPAPIKTLCPQDIVCLCLDVSGSMGSSDRIGKMANTVSVYIMTYLRNATAVGIVSFSDNAYLHADMTEISSTAVRSYLTSSVPRRTVGGTNIGAGLKECQRILRRYAGNRLDETRIVLIGDGAGSLGNSVSSIIQNGITIDTVLYGQGAQLVGIAQQTKGTQNFVSDNLGEQELIQFFIESVSRGCSIKQANTVLQNENIVIAANEKSYEAKVDLDETIGFDTKLVVKCSSEVNLTIETEKNLTTTITRDRSLGIIVATMEGEAGGYIKYTITKLALSGNDVAVLVTVTSAPIPGVQPVAISYRVNNHNIQFSRNTQKEMDFLFFGNWLCRGASRIHTSFKPVNQCFYGTTKWCSGSYKTCRRWNRWLTGLYYTGKDAVPNDGIYTGFVPAHQINGNGGQYFGLKINVSGEGLLQKLVEEAESRGRRSATYTSLGNFARSSTGGVIVINNWRRYLDITPPDRITDLRILHASEGNEVVTLAWTAPGNDLNIGKASGYQFRVAKDLTTQSLLNLPTNAILTEMSGLLREAGHHQEMRVNTSNINIRRFRFNQSADIKTVYLRIRAYDLRRNYAHWSNPASVSFSAPTTTTTTTTTSTTTTTPATTTTPSTTTAVSTTTSALHFTTSAETFTTTFSQLTTSGNLSIVAEEAPATTSQGIPLALIVSVFLCLVGFVSLASAIGLVVAKLPPRSKVKSHNIRGGPVTVRRIRPFSSSAESSFQQEGQQHQPDLSEIMRESLAESNPMYYTNPAYTHM